MPWPSPAAISATITGTAPTTSAACETLVRSMPAFWSRITAPKPTAPAATICGVSAARSPRRPAKASSGAASANRITVSQPPPSQSSESFDSGTVRPHSAPAAARARMAVRFVVIARFMIGRFADFSSVDSPFLATSRNNISRYGHFA